MTTFCACGCWTPAVHLHHVVYAQAVKRFGGDIHDERNLIPLAFACHGNHHSRSRTLPLEVLPDSVFEFAAELMGPGGAYEYLKRVYVGADPRLDALIESEAA